MPNINVTLYKPEEYQKSVHAGLNAHWEDTFHIVKAVRQCGKSMMCENILIKCSLDHAHQTSILISPTLKQARKIFKSIVQKFRGTPLLAAANAQDLEVTFCNDSHILLLSAEQGDNLRGYTITKHGVLIIDEAAYITDEVFYTVTPFVNANHAPIICVSTPRFKSGFFYDFFVDGERGKANVYAYDFTKFSNPYLTPEKLELYKTKVPVNLFKADYLGEWMEASSDLFGDFAKVMSNNVTMDGNYTAGIDWGVGKGAGADSDSTSVAILNGQRQMVRLYTWNDLDETQTIEKIVGILREYGVKKAVCETNSIGSVYLGLLRKQITNKGVPCVLSPFTTTNETKREIIEAFIVAVQNRAIQLLEDNTLKLQMSVYEMQKLPSGKITYNAAGGYHDDAIIATALALHGTTTAQYTVL